jgi:hypothetical protein
MKGASLLAVPAGLSANAICHARKGRGLRVLKTVIRGSFLVVTTLKPGQNACIRGLLQALILITLGVTH